MASVNDAADEPNLSDLGVEHLALTHVSTGTKLTGLQEAIVSATLERSMVGASTLTLEVTDVDDQILSFIDVDETGRLHAMDLTLDKMAFRLQQVSSSYGPDGFRLTMIFEDRWVAYLREHTRFTKVSRGRATRAEFIYSLVKEVQKDGGIGFVCPSLTVKQEQALSEADKQKVRAKSRKDSRKVKDLKRKPGLTTGSSLKVKGTTLTSDQRANAEKLLSIAADLNAGPKATKALIEAAIVESNLTNLDHGDRDSTGILQVRASTARSMGIDPMSIEDVTKAFLLRGFFGHGGAIDQAKKNPGQSAATIAQNTQGSGNPGAYALHADEADAIIADHGGTFSTDSSPTLVEKPYEFTRGTKDPNAPEDSWTAIQRLATEVRWSAWIVDGIMYYMTDEEVSGSRALAIISRQDEYIVEFDFETDNRKPVQQLTMTIFADRWAFPPGSVIIVHDKIKACDGRWIIDNISRDLSSPLAQVTLRRPVKPKKEPAPDSVAADDPNGSSSLDGRVIKIDGKGVLVAGTPKNIIDTIVIPTAVSHGISVTPASVAAANARHGPTVDGNQSDHQGPPDVAWAADMSNGTSPTRQMDALAADLAKMFKIRWTGSGLANATHDGYRFQLIYRTNIGGNHYNHVHLGVRKV